MTDPTEQDIRRIAHHLTEAAHFGRAISGEPHPEATFPPWRLAEARAAYHLGARHDGQGELCGPTEALGDHEASWRRR